MYDEKLLTYAELADALGRSEEAARQLAKRRRWRRSISNEDGKARVAVPVEFLNAPRPPVDRDTAEDESDRSNPGRLEDDREDGITVVEVMRDRVEQLERELAEARIALDAERIRAAQVEALRAVLEVERVRLEEVRQAGDRRVEDVRAERDRWAAAAEAGQRQVAELIAERANRSWWPFRRRAG